MDVYKNENCKITYNEQTLQLTQEWMGYVPSDIFTEGLNISLSCIEKYNVYSVLSDTSLQNVVHPDDVEVAGDFLDLFFSKGVGYMAFVIPENIFARFSLLKFQNLDTNKNVYYFSKREEAQRWLTKKVGQSFLKL